MQIILSEIPEEGLAVGTTAELVSAFSENGWGLRTVSLQLVKKGSAVEVSGLFEGEVPLTCGRCLEPFPFRVAPELAVRLLPKPSVREEELELKGDDLEVDFYDGDVLDVAALLRAETLLALPMKPLCREECRGLCPVCGGNRNQVPCACEIRSADPRLAVLQGFVPKRSS